MNYTLIGLIWFSLGIIFAVLELILPGLVLIFFSLGAIIVSILVWLGLLPTLGFQLFLYLLFSIIFLVLFRKYFKAKLFGKNDTYSLEDEFINKKVIISKIIRDKNYEVQFKGTVWEAESDDDIFALNDEAIIVSRAGLKLKIKREV